MLERLLAQPGRRFHARELASGATHDPQQPDAGGDAGELLDDRARQAYRQRLADLDAELDEAQRFNDGERAVKLGRERDFVLAELRRAIGLGGRPRRAKSVSERARTAVQRRLRDAIERIAKAAPSVGEHLRASVRTGTFCVYEPAPGDSPPRSSSGHV
jgi:hypothetical protein